MKGREKKTKKRHDCISSRKFFPIAKSRFTLPSPCQDRIRTYQCYRLIFGFVVVLLGFVLISLSIICKFSRILLICLDYKNVLVRFNKIVCIERENCGLKRKCSLEGSEYQHWVNDGIPN